MSGAMRQARAPAAWLAVYAVAMGYLEAAVVVYLRRIYYPDDPLRLFPLRVWTSSDLLIELGREVATMLMILAVSLLAVRGAVRRFAAFLFVFGVWDLCYYFWLRVTLGWPRSPAEWDILFLLPWSWCAPWIAPALIALIFAGWGLRELLRGDEPAFPRRARLLFGAGALLALASFLEPALPLLGAGLAGAASFVPCRFLWAAYLPGVGLMTAGLLLQGLERRHQPEGRPGNDAAGPVARRL